MTTWKLTIGNVTRRLSIRHSFSFLSWLTFCHITWSSNFRNSLIWTTWWLSIWSLSLIIIIIFVSLIWRTFYFISFSISPFISSINEISSISFFINNRCLIRISIKNNFQIESKLIANLDAVFASLTFPLILEPTKFIVRVYCSGNFRRKNRTFIWGWYLESWCYYVYFNHR